MVYENSGSAPGTRCNESRFRSHWNLVGLVGVRLPESAVWMGSIRSSGLDASARSPVCWSRGWVLWLVISLSLWGQP